MNSLNPNTPGPPPALPTDDALQPQSADELLAHGLLTFSNLDKPIVQERRIQSVLAAVGQHRRRSRFGISRRTLRGWATAAAVLLIAGAVALMGVPGERSAQAMVKESIKAMRTSGDRRYEVHAMLTGEDQLEDEPHAIVDTRDSGFLLIRGVRPDGMPVIVGRDAQGRWAIRHDGGVDRDGPERAWPRWAVVGNESLFAESIDGLLERLAGMYELTRSDSETLADHGNETFDRVEGLRKLQAWGPGPATFVMWINHQSKIVEKIELRWLPPPEGEGAGPQDEPSGRGENPDRRPNRRGQGPVPEEQGPPRGDFDKGPRGPHPRREGPDMDGRPGPGPESGPRPGRGPDDRGRRPGAGPGGRPDGPPDSPMAAMIEQFGPLGPLGILRDPMIRPRPGRGMPRPKLLVIERVSTASFDNNWFSPEIHMQNP